MRSPRTDGDGGCVWGSMAEEGLRNPERAGDVELNGFEVLLAVGHPHWLLGPDLSRAVDEDVDLAGASKLGKGCIDVALLGDIGGDGDDLDARELVLDVDFVVEKGLHAAAEERDARRACGGKVARRLAADPSSSAGDDDGFAFGGQLGTGGGCGWLRFCVPPFCRGRERRSVGHGDCGMQRCLLLSSIEGRGEE